MSMKVIIKGRKIYVGFFKIFLYYDNFCRLVVFHIFIRSWRKPVTHISRERLSLDGIIVNHLGSSAGSRSPQQGQVVTKLGALLD